MSLWSNIKKIENSNNTEEVFGGSSNSVTGINSAVLGGVGNNVAAA